MFFQFVICSFCKLGGYGNGWKLICSTIEGKKERKGKFLISSVFLSQGRTKIGGMLPPVTVDGMVWL
jgi:hypothetical protein